MIHLQGFDDLTEEIHFQINNVVNIWEKHVGNQLVGIYLHGSIALHAFLPQSGDIDILIVVEESLSIATKLAIAKEIIEIDDKPCPLEMSAVRLCDVKPWKTPGNCVFHYSNYWTEQYLEKLSNPNTECYITDNEFPDADVTSYIKLINQCGIVLYGRKIERVFSEISDEDFWMAISEDVEDYDFHDYAPRYLASNLLILGRILSFKETKQILSKYEGGLWMIDHVPTDLKYLPERALKEWYEGEKQEFPEEDLERLKQYLLCKISQ